MSTSMSQSGSPQNPPPVALSETAPVDPEIIAKRTPGLYRGMVEGMPFVWNPRGEDALAVLNAGGLAVLDQIDGQSTLGMIRKQLGFSRDAFDAVIRRHFKNGF